MRFYYEHKNKYILRLYLKSKDKMITYTQDIPAPQIDAEDLKYIEDQINRHFLDKIDKEPTTESKLIALIDEFIIQLQNIDNQ